MDLRTLSLKARNLGQLRASHGAVTVQARRTHIGWQHTYYVNGVGCGAKAAEKALKKIVCAESKA